MNDAMTYGWLNDYAMTFTMNNDSDRGFVWRDTDDAKSDAAMTLTTSGNLMVKNAIGIAGKTGNYWKDGSWGFRHQTPHGYIEFGPANSSYAHIYTDRSNFYFNVNTLYANGNTMWHAGNDGSGSGLDADTVDGIQASSFLRSDTDDSVSSYTNNIRFPSNSAINTSSGSQASLEVYSGNGSGTDAFMTFHVGGDYALYFGLDGGTNDLAVGGWSKGAASYKVWHEANDGSGSGLDADLWDGNQFSSYLNQAVKSTSNPTFNQIFANDWFRVNGSDGIYWQSHGGGWYMTDTTWMRIYNSKKLYITNEIAATGNVTAYYSDIRLKEKLGDIDNALFKVNQIETFFYKENDLAKKFGFNKPDKQVGVSAQSVEKVLPEVVSLAPFDFETAEDGTISSKSGENYKTVDYEKLVPLLIESIKELTNKVKVLENKLNVE